MSLTKGANCLHLTASAYVGVCLCLCQSVNQPLGMPLAEWYTTKTRGSMQPTQENQKVSHCDLCVHVWFLSFSFRLSEIFDGLAWKVYFVFPFRSLSSISARNVSRSNYDPLTLAASASGQFLLKDFNAFFRFCVGFPHTSSGAAIFLSFFIYLYTRVKCSHVVSVRKRENPGNEKAV